MCILGAPIELLFLFFGFSFFISGTFIRICPCMLLLTAKSQDNEKLY